MRRALVCIVSVLHVSHAFYSPPTAARSPLLSRETRINSRCSMLRPQHSCSHRGERLSAAEGAAAAMTGRRRRGGVSPLRAVVERSAQVMGQEPQMQGRGRLWGLRRLLSASRRTGRRVLDSLLLKAVLAFMVFVASPTMLVSSIKRAGLDVPAITRTVQAQASPWKRFSSRTLEEKLAGVPAFMVVNSQGQPYLTPVGPSEQAGLFFTNLEDAKQMLSEMVQIPNYQKDARIYVVPLEKVFTMIEKGPTETGSVRSGQRETMTFLMYPDNRAMEEYYEQAQIKTKPPGVVPVFSVEGLLIEKDGCKVKPLFFDLADLNKAYRDMRRKNKKISYRPKITMYSLPEVLVQMREDEKGNFKDYGFVPSSKSMEFLAEAKKQKGHRSRLARMSRF